MRTVEITKNGVELGSVSFRGIAASQPMAEAAASTSKEKRLYRCSPSACVSKDVARRIADSLSGGSVGGREDDYEWHT